MTVLLKKNMHLYQELKLLKNIIKQYELSLYIYSLR